MTIANQQHVLSSLIPKPDESTFNQSLMPSLLNHASLRSLARFVVCMTALGIPARAETSVPAASSVKFTEVIRKEVRFGDHTMTLVCVRPPVLPDAPVTPPPPPRSLTAEEKAYEERVAKKAYATLNVSAAVYLGGKNPVTELRWCDATGKREFRAWSNIDFRYLAQISMIETETTIYSWFPFLEIYDLAEWPADQKSPLPPGLVLAAGEPAYFVDSPVAKLNEEEATLAGLDYLHAYYQLHYAELKADHERREVLNAAEAKKLRENPPRTPDATFRFWPIKSRLHSR